MVTMQEHTSAKPVEGRRRINSVLFVDGISNIAVGTRFKQR
jgi:hypothetical protein